MVLSVLTLSLLPRIKRVNEVSIELAMLTAQCTCMSKDGDRPFFVDIFGTADIHVF